MGIAFPGESSEYRAARDRLLEQEIELRRAMESAAAARRELPPGGVVPEDYVFQGAGADGTPADVRLSELFAPARDSLAIYSFMFPRDPGDERPGPATGETALLPLEEGPCPSCVAFLDQLDGAAEHASQHLNFAVVAKAPLPRCRDDGPARGLSLPGNGTQAGISRARHAVFGAAGRLRNRFATRPASGAICADRQSGSLQRQAGLFGLIECAS